MNMKQSLVVFGTAALCGLALAQTPIVPGTAERLDALEREVATLRTQLGTQQAAGDELLALRKELGETRALANQLAGWAGGQAKGAAELAKVLDESEQKGFTYGINPDSRTVLLAGWREFVAGLQQDTPKPLDGKDAAVAKDAKLPARKQ